MPGRSTLTATCFAAVGLAHRALCTWAIEAAATGGPNSAKSSSIGAPSASSTAARASPCGNGGRRSWSVRQIAGQLAADDVVAGGEELAELDVGRPERGQRFGQPRLVAVAGAVLRSGAVTRANSASGPGKFA